MVWKFLEWMTGRSVTPAQLLQRHQRALNKAIRSIERERANMERQETKIIADIKKTAKLGQMDAVKIMAKDLVQTRRHVKKFMLMKANLQGVLMKIATLRSQHSISEALRGVTLALRSMNQRLQLPTIRRILQEFEKQSMIMDMKEEMMSESVDDAFDDENDEEEESESIVAQIFDELGLQLTDQLSELPQEKGNTLSQSTQKVAVSVAATATNEPTVDTVDELEARLNRLRRN